MTRRTLVAFIVALLAATASCAVPTDETAQIVDQSSLDEVLRNSTTTTTTTTAPLTPREVFFYLLRQPAETEQRQVVRVPLAQPASEEFAPLIAPMFEPDFDISASELAGENLTNSLAEYTLVDIVVNDGLATVYLDSEDPPGNAVLKDAAAQLVWTLTESFGNVDEMVINFAGQPLSLPNSENNGTTDPVSPEDYALYSPTE